MSFFGFDTTLPRDRGHQTAAPGFGQTQDAFAGLSSRPDAFGESDTLDFEETYDGLGDQLDETDDAFNDDTFGEAPATQQSIGKDFDFAGRTAQMSNVLQEEGLLHAVRQPPRRASPPKPVAKPRRTGYESYAESSYIPKLEADASIWGTAPKKPAQEAQPSNQSASAPARKMMSVEEVEAMMRAQASQPQPQTQPVRPPPQQLPPTMQYDFPPSQPTPQQPGFAGPPQILQRPQQQIPDQRQGTTQRHPVQAELPGQGVHQPQILQRQRPEHSQPRHGGTPSQHGIQFQQQQQQAQHRQQQQQQQQPPQQGAPLQPRQILQNPNRLSGHGQPLAPQYRNQDMPRVPPTGPSHHRGPSYQGPVITNPQQILNLSEEDRAAYLAEEAKRAKRNHKIYLLSQGNHLMTPQDKNFITRIQLQQLVTATGGADEAGGESLLAEDFYYQVYAQIRGASRQHPNQPANQFAQTYLFQTGGRFGMSGRRQQRGGDNHMQRMEQQVQRAVEAAKLKPKNKQLVIEGSLGKISFSNSKTPKPLLNIKRSEDSRPPSAGPRVSRAKNGSTIPDRKVALRDLEKIYDTLMVLEDHERRMPRLREDSDAAVVQSHMEWTQQMESLNQRLWTELKVMEPIIPNSTTAHPFIALLSHPKGKKAIPRVFRHLSEQQRVTILTMLVIQLDGLDVISAALPPASAGPHADAIVPSASVRDEVELFAMSVIPPLFTYVSDAPLHIVVGLLGLALDRTNISNLIRTKIGLGILTMFVSRAELIRQAQGAAGSSDWDVWTSHYDRLFDEAESELPFIFPGGSNAASLKEVDDVHVWQFLAAMGVGASPDQQQRLVLGVKERVMETVAVSKALPADLAAKRLGNVNLFMRAIGLDVELLG
ncbi:hypothetical protein K402DRAFT_335197 [Aulographum hederae CBS 113979]|uniref:mRNA decay factor PAT1 domain-containing protein n=1 Tax=Aulographum hederae CBS 113979 TaxID=1176131 RepID=A0A6G1GWG6_9PEZI|nr:hypothetical protein K402DRAFT_335197 [Aulographum hederae CBS 113979]